MSQQTKEGTSKYQNTFIILHYFSQNICYQKKFKPEKARLCHKDTDSFIVHIKTDDIYKDIAETIKTRFDTSNYELDRLYPKEKKKKVIRLMS